MKPFEEKIVKLTLDMNTFKSHAVVAIGMMGKIKDSITSLGKVDAKGASTVLKDIADTSKVAERGMHDVTEATKKTTSAFNALKTMATGALLGLGNQFAQKMLGTLKKFTLDPITDGFREYELKTRSMQTIITNTGESVSKVNGVLDQLNKYSDLTIYNFNDMTKAIGSLSTSGMKLEDSTSVVKGFFNLAAGTGVEAARASSLLDTAMVQAIQIGKMDYQNWKQLQSAGMGGPKFKDALVQNAKAMGIQVDLSNGFNESLKQGWATTDVMLATMKQFENDKSLLEAATKVRTFTQLMDTAREAVGSSWARTWEIVFGDFDEATLLWSGVWGAIEPIIKGIDAVRNGFLLIFKEANGFKAITETFANIYRFIKQITDAIGKGFTTSLGKLSEGLKTIPQLLTIPFKILEHITRKLADIKLIPAAIGFAFKALFSVFGLVADALFVIFDAVMFVVNGVKKLFNAFKDLYTAIPWAKMIEPFVKMAATIKDISFKPLTEGFKGLISPIAAVKESMYTWSLTPIKNWVSDSGSIIINGFTNAAKGLKNIFSPKFWAGLWTGFTDAYHEAISTFTNSKAIVNIISQFDKLKEVMMALPNKLFGDLFEKFSVTNIVDGLDGLIGESTSKGLVNVATLLLKVRDAITITYTVLGNVADGVKEKFVSTFDVLNRTFIDLKDGAANLIGAFDLGKMFSGIKDFASLDKVTGFIQTITNSAKAKGLSTLASGLDLLASGVLRLIEVSGKIGGSINNGLGKALSYLSTELQNALPHIQAFFDKFNRTNILNTLEDMATGVVNFANSIDWSPITKSIDVVVEAFSNFKDRIQWVFDLVPNLDWLELIQNGVLKLIEIIKELGTTKVANAAEIGIEGIGKAAEKSKTFLEKFKEVLGQVGDVIKDGFLKAIELTIAGLGMMANGIKNISLKIYDFIVNAKSNLEGFQKFIDGWREKIEETFGNVFSTENLIKGGLLAGLGIMIKGLFDFQSNGNNLLKKIGDSFDKLGNLPEVLSEIADSIFGFQEKLSASSIVKIAGAISILALSLKLLSTIESDKLVSTLGFVSIGVGAMVAVFGAMALVNKFGSGKGMLTSVLAIATIAGSILVLSGALKVLSTIDEDGLKRALSALAGTLTILVIAIGALKFVTGGNMTVTLAGITGLATATIILSTAVQKFAEIDAAKLIKGGIAVAVALVAMGGAMKIMGGNPALTVGSALAIMMMALSIKMLVKPVKALSEIELPQLAKGLAAIGGALALAVFALAGLSANSLGAMGAAIAIGMVAGALLLLTVPILILGNLELPTLAKGVGAVAVALLLIFKALSVLSVNAVGTLAGAAAIALVAAALTLLVIPVTLFGTMSWGTIIKGLTGMALALVLVVGAGYLATGASIGLGMLAASMGTLALAAVGIALMLTATVAILEYFTSSTKDTFSTLVDNIIFFLKEIERILPAFTDTATAVIESFIQIIEKAIPRIAGVGYDFLMGLLNGIRDHIGEVVTVVSEILIEFAEAFGENYGPVIDAAVQLATDMINALATAIDTNAGPFMDAVKRLLGAVLILMVEGFELLIELMFGWSDTIMGLTSGIGEAARDGIREHFNLETSEETSRAAIEGLIGGVTSRDQEVKDVALNTSTLLNTGLGSSDTNKTGSDKVDEYNTGARTKFGVVAGTGDDLSATLDGGLGSSNTNNTGSSQVTGFITGADGKKGSAKTTAEGISTTVDKALGSANTYGTGGSQVAGFNSGARSKRGEAYTTSEDISSRANKGLNSQDTYTSGTNFSQGFINGIGSMWEDVKDTASWIGSLAVDWLDKGAGNASPSKKTYQSGDWFGQGMVNGMVNQVSNVKNVAENMGKTAVAKLSDSTSNMSNVFKDMMTSKLDLSPVITPTLDMSKIKMEEFNRTYSAFSNNRIVNPEVLGKKSPEEKSGNSVVNNFDLKFETYGDLPRGTVKRWAQEFQEEVTSVFNRDSLAKGEVVY